MRKPILLLSLLLSAITLPSCSLLGVPLDSDQFPDPNLYMWVRTCDMNRNGYLSDKEIEDAKSLLSGMNAMINYHKGTCNWYCSQDEG